MVVNKQENPRTSGTRRSAKVGNIRKHEFGHEAITQYIRKSGMPAGLGGPKASGTRKCAKVGNIRQNEFVH